MNTTPDGSIGNNTYKAFTELAKGSIMCLDLDATVRLGSINRRTWAALLHSKGDPERQRMRVTVRQFWMQQKLLQLKERGYEYVGRYLTGTVKVNGERK